MGVYALVCSEYILVSYNLDYEIKNNNYPPATDPKSLWPEQSIYA